MQVCPTRSVVKTLEHPITHSGIQGSVSRTNRYHTSIDATQSGGRCFPASSTLRAFEESAAPILRATGVDVGRSRRINGQRTAKVAGETVINSIPALPSISASDN